MVSKVKSEDNKISWNKIMVPYGMIVFIILLFTIGVISESRDIKPPITKNEEIKDINNFENKVLLTDAYKTLIKLNPEKKFSFTRFSYDSLEAKELVEGLEGICSTTLPKSNMSIFMEDGVLIIMDDQNETICDDVSQKNIDKLNSLDKIISKHGYIVSNPKTSFCLVEPNPYNERWINGFVKEGVNQTLKDEIKQVFLDYYNSYRSYEKHEKLMTYSEYIQKDICATIKISSEKEFYPFLGFIYLFDATENKYYMRGLKGGGSMDSATESIITARFYDDCLSDGCKKDNEFYLIYIPSEGINPQEIKNITKLLGRDYTYPLRVFF